MSPMTSRTTTTPPTIQYSKRRSRRGWLLRGRRGRGLAVDAAFGLGRLPAGLAQLQEQPRGHQAEQHGAREDQRAVSEGAPALELRRRHEADDDRRGRGD